MAISLPAQLIIKLFVSLLATVFSFFQQTKITQRTLELMSEKRINALAYELVYDKSGTSPFNTAISEIKTCSEGYELVTEKGDIARCQYLIAAPGRSGAEWFARRGRRRQDLFRRHDALQGRPRRRRDRPSHH